MKVLFYLSPHHLETLDSFKSEERSTRSQIVAWLIDRGAAARQKPGPRPEVKAPEVQGDCEHRRTTPVSTTIGQINQCLACGRRRGKDGQWR